MILGSLSRSTLVNFFSILIFIYTNCLIRKRTKSIHLVIAKNKCSMWSIGVSLPWTMKKLIIQIDFFL